MRLEFTIEVRRSVREVFGIVSDLDNDPKWQKAVSEATKVSTGPVAKGTRYRHVVRLMGRASVVDMEFQQFVPGKRYVLACVTGPLEFTTEVNFESTMIGTRLLMLIAGQPKGLAKLAAITLSSHRRHEIEADLRNLKRMLEAGLL